MESRHFNPRPLAGATGSVPAPCGHSPISIHAPLRGRPICFATVAKDMVFQSTPPCGGDAASCACLAASWDFNPRPLAGATDVAIDVVVFNGISIHAPLRGRHSTLVALMISLPFQSTPPCGGDVIFRAFRGNIHISIHAPLRGRPAVSYAVVPFGLFQSTPPCGGDRLSFLPCGQLNYFNPRPLAGATPKQKQSNGMPGFQSTPPCGGDNNPYILAAIQPDFNPRPLAGATFRPGVLGRDSYISIHAPLRGRLSRSPTDYEQLLFQSTPPCGGDSPRLWASPGASYFNPRPLAGATEMRAMLDADEENFNPRPLAGATGSSHPYSLLPRFQSTPPCGGDQEPRQFALLVGISIHAPLRGRPEPLHLSVRQCYFNPRPLAGATVTVVGPVLTTVFQSTPPCGGDCGYRVAKRYF